MISIVTINVYIYLAYENQINCKFQSYFSKILTIRIAYRIIQGKTRLSRNSGPDEFRDFGKGLVPKKPRFPRKSRKFCLESQKNLRLTGHDGN